MARDRSFPIRRRIVYLVERIGRVIAIATEPRYLTGRDG